MLHFCRESNKKSTRGFDEIREGYHENTKRHICTAAPLNFYSSSLFYIL